MATKKETVSLQARIPRATYRVQFGKSFTFRQSRELVSYWDELGISDLYASPFFKACDREGAGYDVCDHGAFNPAIGTPEDFEALSASLRERSMGLLLDVVPNHMGISANNPWWMDVLENGPSSPYSCFFDIDFHPAKPELENKVLLPILEGQYGKVLEDGKFKLRLEEGAFVIDYYEHKLPVAPRTYSRILGIALDNLVQTLAKESELLQEFQSILTGLNYLPSQTESAAEKLEERMREKEVIKRRISQLCQNSTEVKAAVDEAVQSFNGRTGDPRSFDLMDGLINAQAYWPAFWRVAADEINYRRFFDVNHLAAIRMELPRVFAEVHRMIFDLLEEGKITGLRIDHPDGLWNPTQYFHQLQKRYVLRRLRSRGDPGEPEPADLSAASLPLYVVAEKILSEGEPLPRDWAVHGTTGYDFLNEVNGLFVDRENLRLFDRIYSHFVGTRTRFRNLANSSKKMIMLISMAGEIQALGHALERLSEKNRWYRDFTLNSLTFVLREIVACLPVYRTYITGPENVPEPDIAYTEAAVEEAKRRNPRTAESIFDFVRDILLLRNLSSFPEEDRPRLIQFVMKFQQVTGPVMAKGLEDTAFYVYNPLVSLNEVGGHPDQFGVSAADFHQRNEDRRKDWPHSLLATSTHDTKRSEDVRARINVLSEIPGEWRAAVNRWSRWNTSKKTRVDGQPAPDRNDEYLLYQTLVGAWPISREGNRSDLNSEELSLFRERIAGYMRKATLEAKVHTSWVNPNEAYDEAVKNFVHRLLADGGRTRFLGDLQAFQRRVAYFGQWNSLSQVLLKLTCPGVPDFYQGTELWDFSLVDPDNRRPVDYPQRRAMLAELKEKGEASGGALLPLARNLLETSWDGRIKLYLIYRTLNFRRENPELFADGTYLPLEAGGEKKDHVIAFSRGYGRREILVAVPRLVAGLTGGEERAPLGKGVWGDTRLLRESQDPGQTYRNLLTGEMISAGAAGKASGLGLAEIFAAFPVALLEAVGG
jgi:(1->4)-alpha-D-glucan 1-alpha-D-glucosylmutase